MPKSVRMCVIATAAFLSACSSTAITSARVRAPTKTLCKTVKVHAGTKKVCYTSTPSPAPVRRKTRSSLPAGPPQRLMIPRIGVRTYVEQTALKSAWDWRAPHTWWNAAWYSRGPRPGDTGRALIFGHLDSTCCPALFWSLGALQPGDIVAVAYRTGHPVTFRVAWKNVYWNNARSVHWVFQTATDHDLVLVTCAGIFYPGRGYDRRLLVYAHLVGKG